MSVSGLLSYQATGWALVVLVAIEALAVAALVVWARRSDARRARHAEFLARVRSYTSEGR